MEATRDISFKCGLCKKHLAVDDAKVKKIAKTIFVIIIFTALTVAEFTTQSFATSENQDGQTNVLVIGYVWAKNPVSATQNLTSPFKPLKSGKVYQSLGTTTNGLLIICELANGQKALALMPFKDAMGYQVLIKKKEKNTVTLTHPILDNLDTLRLKPADVPLEVGHRYVVVGRRDDMFTLVFSDGEFSQPVETVATNIEFLSVADYQKKRMAVLDGLRHTAEQRMGDIANGNDSSLIADVFLKYSGLLTDETVNEREQIAKEYVNAVNKLHDDVLKKRVAELILARQKLEEYIASQKAKGLVEYLGKWITQEEMNSKIDEERKKEQLAKEAAYMSRMSQPPVDSSRTFEDLMNSFKVNRGPPLVVSNVRSGSGQFGNRVLRGTVHNNTDKQYSYAQVEINLYDRSGAQVGSTFANINNLEPNADWNFEAGVLEDSTVSFKVKKVTGY